MKRAAVLLCLLIATTALYGAGASASPSPTSERRATPPNVVGLKLPAAESRLRAEGWAPRPFNTDTLFGIIVKRHYTVCKQYRPIGVRVRLLAQKYGC